jgi:hypothetical protein
MRCCMSQTLAVYCIALQWKQHADSSTCTRHITCQKVRRLAAGTGAHAGQAHRSAGAGCFCAPRPHLHHRSLELFVTIEQVLQGP